MSQIFEPNEPVNFEKWVSKELGYEMGKALGQQKFANPTQCLNDLI